jgi:predicted DNA-binding transcriptional regulator AlpA
MPEAHHLDRRAGLLIRVGEQDGAGDDLLNSEQLAVWLAVSKQWVEIARHRGFGPAFIKLSGRVRYRRSDVIQWLEQRRHNSTSEYKTRGRRRRPTPDAPAPESKIGESLKGYRRLSPRQMEVLSRSTRRRWSRGRGRRAPGGGRGGGHGGEPAGTQPPGHPRCADQ